MHKNEINSFVHSLKDTPKMPVLFLGHGSPMNAIEENEFVVGFRQVAQSIPTPQAILCVSAHWETRGTFVTAMKHPRTIHDFGGFPKALYEVQYPAPGSTELAEATKEMVQAVEVGLDYQWGIDHGAWSVIKHLYPLANVPVVQLSLNHTQSAVYHYELAKEIRSLRGKGVLIIGSGNMVHNLRLLAWDHLYTDNYAYDWAKEADQIIKWNILNNNHQNLVNYRTLGKALELAVPTPEHFLPLLYVLALKDNVDEIQWFNDKAVAGSLTMTSIKISNKE